MLIATGYDGNARLPHEAPRFHLVAQQPDRLVVRPDEDQPSLLARLGEQRVLGEKAVTGVDGVGAGSHRHVQQPRYAQVGRARRSLADKVSLVRHAHVHAVRAHIAEHGHGGAQLAAGPNHWTAIRPVGDQHLLNHRELPS